MAASPVLREIESLDPVRDHLRIVCLSCRQDFPWDTTRTFELALFCTFAIPSISALLDRTKEFEHRAQKRYDDTDIIVSEMMEHGYDSERGRAAFKRMNALHGRFQIANEDFLYVLSTFIFEPMRWNARFGWRRMNIRDIPEDMAVFEKFSTGYESEHFRFTETNRRVGSATRELFASWFPSPLAPLVRRGIHAFLDEPLREAFGFPKPSRLLRWLVEASLKLRGKLLRFLPRRQRPVLRTEMKQRTYPCGYQIEKLGPPSTG